MHSSIKYGIRPLLYSILRRQFINPRGFAFCANTECRNFFNIERAGQQFCSSGVFTATSPANLLATTGQEAEREKDRPGQEDAEAGCQTDHEKDSTEQID